MTEEATMKNLERAFQADEELASAKALGYVEGSKAGQWG